MTSDKIGTPNPKDPLEDLIRRSKMTSDIRFQASIRLKNRQKASTYAISCLSLFVIALSTIPTIINISYHKSQILLSCSIILSVFIIFTSIIDASEEFTYKSKMLYECARDLDAIYRKAKYLSLKNEKEDYQFNSKIDELNEKYDDILNKFTENHDNIDYSLFREKNKESPSRLKMSWLIFCKHKWIYPYVICMGSVIFVVYFLVIKGSPWLEAPSLPSPVP